MLAGCASRKDETSARAPPMWRELFVVQIFVSLTRLVPKMHTMSLVHPWQ